MPGGSKVASRDLAACALAAGKTIAEAAVAANAKERTVKDWNTDATFRARVTALRSEMVGRACGELADSMSAAAKKLRALVDRGPDMIALRASVALIASALRVAELTELQTRVEELERVLAARGRRETHQTDREAGSGAGRAPVPQVRHDAQRGTEQ
jgi:hypothetical protein